MEAEQGIRHVVATPHFYAQHDSPEQFLKRRRASEMYLREVMAGFKGLPQISIGAEVYYFSGMSESDILSELTIQNTKYILVEMPLSTWTNQMYDELYKIRAKRGLTPIIAHVDRYISPFMTHRIPERLKELPVLVQANAEFFLLRSTQRMAMRMLRKDRIHLLGSDCHNLTERMPNLGMAVQKIEQHLGKETIKQINFYEDEILHSCIR